MDFRDELIQATKKGIPFPIAGMLVITFAAVVVQLLPQIQALKAIIYATGAVFPVAFFIGQLMRVNPFVKLPPLSGLAAILAVIQLFYWPVFILVFVMLPAWLPFVMAVLFGSHFIPYGWLYKSTAYYFIGFVMPAVGCLLAVFGKEVSYQYTFAALVPVYAICCALLLQENKAVKIEVVGSEQVI